jgi:hypothetical protein
MAEAINGRIVIDMKAVDAEIEAIKANPTPDWEQRLRAVIRANSSVAF